MMEKYENWWKETTENKTNWWEDPTDEELEKEIANIAHENTDSYMMYASNY